MSFRTKDINWFHFDVGGTLNPKKQDSIEREQAFLLAVDKLFKDNSDLYDAYLISIKTNDSDIIETSYSGVYSKLIFLLKKGFEHVERGFIDA